MLVGLNYATIMLILIWYTLIDWRQTRLIQKCLFNEGYAGRTELPDNLKSMFRPISMMVPDSMLIAEITLFGEGFRDTRNLAKKVRCCFSLYACLSMKQYFWTFYY